MQMIDVLKRLAELDSQNPNIVKESKIDECGMMPEMGLPMAAPQQPSMPASLNITAGSGEELSDMIKAIATLAGVKPVGADDLGVEHEPSAMVATPVMGAGAPETGGDNMRSVIDRMNDAGGPEDGQEGGKEDDKEETDEGEYDNSPADAEPKKPFDSNEFANQENQPGAGDTPDGQRRSGFQPATFESLMDEYKEFVSESKKKITESSDSYGDILKHYPKEVQDFKDGGDLDYDLQSALWDYHFNNGDIRNYDADASEYIGQNLADYLGIDEAYGRRGSSGSYNPDAWAQKDWNAGKAADDDFRNRERNAGLENEPPNNFQITINGKPWKVFAGKNPPDSMEERQHLSSMKKWADGKSAATGKKWDVYLTGAPASA